MKQMIICASGQGRLIKSWLLIAVVLCSMLMVRGRRARPAIRVRLRVGRSSKIVWLVGGVPSLVEVIRIVGSTKTIVQIIIGEEQIIIIRVCGEIMGVTKVV